MQAARYYGKHVAERYGVADVMLDPRLEDFRSQLRKFLPAGGEDVVFGCAASASLFDVVLSVFKPKASGKSSPCIRIHHRSTYIVWP